MSYDDALRASREHLRLGMTRAGRKYLDPAKLGEEIPDPYEAPDDAELTHDDFPPAVRQLAGRHGTGSGRVEGMARRAHQLAGLGYSVGERARVLGEVMVALSRGEDEVSNEQVLELSGRGGADLADTVGTHSAAGDEVALAGQTQETRAMRLTAAGQDSAEAAIARHPELSHLFRAGKTSSRRHPAKPGRAGMLTTDSRAHSSDLDESTQDTAQPARGGAVHADVRRLIEANPDLFAPDHGREGEGTGNTSYAPKSAAQRHLEETYALASGRPQARITR